MTEAVEADPVTDSSLPNLLIIGAAKAGTTSLHRYLSLHPDVFMSRRKELHLFSKPDWHERVRWYRAQFTEALPVRGESSPEYTMHPWFPDVPQRARRLIPDARLIYLVRDPIERLVAQYVEHLALGFERRRIDDALADYESPENRFVTASRYAYQLDRWREEFPDRRILVIDQAELLEARAETLRRAFSFLGVDENFSSPDFNRLYNARLAKVRPNRLGLWLHNRGLLGKAREASRALPTTVRDRWLKPLVSDPVASVALDPALRVELESYLAAEIERLRSHTGLAFARWSI